MNLDTLLSILGLATSIGGLIPIFIIKESHRKELTITVIVSFLIVLTAVMAVRDQQHDRAVRATQMELLRALSGSRWTLDQLYKQQHYPQREIFFEAISDAVEQHRVEQRVQEVRIDDGPPIDVRLYWVVDPDGRLAKTE